MARLESKHIEGLKLAIVRTGMKGMTETKRVGGKGIGMRPTETGDMQSCRRRVVMQHTIKQNTGYIIHVHTSYDKQMKSDTYIHHAQRRSRGYTS